MTEIRQAVTDAEIDEVARLADFIWHEHFAKILTVAQIDYMLDRFLSAAALQKAIREDGYEYYLVRHGGDTVGFIGIRPEDKKLFLSKLYLKKSSRGQGFATEMLAFVMTRAKVLGAEEVYLTCNKYNDNTLAIYRHWGFVTTDSVVTDIGGGYVMDDYIMAKAVEA